MKRHLISYISILTLVLLATVFISAQVRPPIPRPSQKASVMQTIGSTDMTITYSRPPVKGRTIFADAPASMAARAKGEATLDNQKERVKGEPIVPYGHVWRTGANEATLFVVTDDVLINGQPLAAGKYSLHSIPGKDDWTFIFNKDDGQWGSFTYDAAKDALRVKAKPAWAADSQELLTYDVEPVTDNSAMVNVKWERLRVPFTVEVKNVVATTLAHLHPFVAGAKSDDFGTPLQAANYAKANKAQDDAAKWYDQANKAIDEQIKAKPSFANLTQKANILFNAGRMPEAIAAGDKAVEAGKAEKADTSALEKRIADAKAGKQ